MSGRFPAAQMHMVIMPGAVQAARRAVECGRFLGIRTWSRHGPAGPVLDVAGAASELRQAVDLKSGCAEAHLWRALALAAMGRFEEIDMELHRVGELDPSGPEALTVSALVWYMARRHERAATAAGVGSSSTATSGSSTRSRGWPGGRGRGGARDRIAEEGVRDVGFQPVASAALGHVMGLTGRRDEAMTLVRDLDLLKSRRVVPAYATAIILAGLGDAEGRARGSTRRSTNSSTGSCS